MKEKLVLLNDIDYVFEGYTLLRTLASDKLEEYEKFKRSVTEKYGSNSKHTRDCLELGEKILRRANSVFHDRKEQINTYFAEVENDIIPADLVMCWTAVVESEQDLKRNVSDIRKNYESMCDAERDRYFFLMLDFDMDLAEFDRVVGCEERGALVADAERVRNIFDYIQKMDLKIESKMRIQEIYLNRDAYLEDICKLWEDAVTVLHEFETEMRRLCDEWENCWRGMMERDEFFSMLGSIVEMNDDVLKNGICVLPAVVQCVSMMIHIYGQFIPAHSQSMTTCRIGILMGEEFNWNSQMREENRWEEMQPVFKALGEGSKADILMFIKDKPAYGSEIAKQFSLTTATVSHHMNKLVQLRLVQTEMRDGRVYYQARKDVLREMFEQCRKMFE